ncbi:zinc finger BED domain-containing protein DAYSLEEPER-like isoform X2 [Polypterus senegalus]|uniref:zinc finger BED domain-containing protein DAYSLEEPER-like isoform X2 n=1 Tax=Polypterus senegalus TaxID=55291 RepID=UPI0019661A93|nr:zinc finger BED domain-containing protein DAYSLEEPER-like isoform X2 [Polypterus senegalus]
MGKRTANIKEEDSKWEPAQTKQENLCVKGEDCEPASVSIKEEPEDKPCMSEFQHGYPDGAESGQCLSPRPSVHVKTESAISDTKVIAKKTRRATAKNRQSSDSQSGENLKQKHGSPKQQNIPSSPPEKRRRPFHDNLSDVEDIINEDLREYDEVSTYIELKVTEDDHFDLLNWWKEHSEMFPSLARIARSILSIPATSATSERDFSTAGCVISERRSQLSPETVDDVLFLHSNPK